MERTVRSMAEAARCEATTTVKGKPVRCDQPATADRGGHAVCLKHDRAVWIEYVKITNQDHAGLDNTT
jgi:hypothetical protein